MNKEWNNFFDQEKLDALDAFIESIPDKRGALITVLHRAQHLFGYVSHDMQRYIGEKLDIPSAKVNGVVTFYSHFSEDPKGRYVIKICDGTACHVRKSIPILEELQRELKLEQGQCTTKDWLFTVETVSCLGACGLAPVITVNDKVYPAMTPAKTKDLLETLRKESSHEMQ